MLTNATTIDPTAAPIPIAAFFMTSACGGWVWELLLCLLVLELARVIGG